MKLQRLINCGKILIVYFWREVAYVPEKINILYYMNFSSSGGLRYSLLCGFVTVCIPILANLRLLWAPAQRKRATMLYFANVFYLFIYFFYGRLILRPW